MTFIQYLRRLADDELEPVEAVKAYHADLQQLNIRPHRVLADDLQLSQTSTSYGGSSGPRKQSGATSGQEPDFSKMTQAEKVQWNLERWNRILG